MTIRSRTELKSFFIRNAIPTEENFADLIDSSLSLSDDGVARPAGEALRVNAVDAGQRRAIGLYPSPAAANPDWLVALNPGTDPLQPTSNRPGFGLADTTGVVRLFLDQQGRLGVGTNTPAVDSLLDVRGKARFGDVAGANLQLSGSASAASLQLSGNASAAGSLTVGGALTVTGSINGRSVQNDGTRLDSHVANRSNPHGVTAAQVGALSTGGGTVSGSLSVGGTLTANGALTASGAFTANGATRLDGGHTQFGTQTSAGGAYAYVSNHYDQNVTMVVTSGHIGSLGTGTKASLLIWPMAAGFSGLNVFAASAGTNCAVFGGPVHFSAGKGGYVVDTVVNGSSTNLRPGDVVKLKPGKLSYYGEHNAIPVPEVTLSDRAGDPLAIGIVCSEATAAPDEPDDRSDPEDPTTIPPGGKAFIVTLGCYAHCRVDASRGPIAVGDLLTTSNTAGHAEKAKNPAVGTIIGKALEPLESGAGYIAVFVNIQ